MTKEWWDMTDKEKLWHLLERVEKLEGVAPRPERPRKMAEILRDVRLREFPWLKYPNGDFGEIDKGLSKAALEAVREKIKSILPAYTTEHQFNKAYVPVDELNKALNELL